MVAGKEEGEGTYPAHNVPACNSNNCDVFAVSPGLTTTQRRRLLNNVRTDPRYAELFFYCKQPLIVKHIFCIPIAGTTFTTVDDLNGSSQRNSAASQKLVVFVKQLTVRLCRAIRWNRQQQ